MVVNIHGDILSTDMHYFSENLKDRRKLYFEMALTKDLQNIRYNNVEVVSQNIMEEIQPFQIDAALSDTEE